MKPVLAILALSFATTAFAADYTSQFKDAYSDFTQRDAGNTFAQSCADKAAVAATLAANNNDKYDALILQSRCLYFVGLTADDSGTKVRVFGNGKDIADKAKSLLADRAEGYYYYAINLGRWAEANGILKSLGERKNLQRNAETVKQKMAVVDGKTTPGAELDSYGANRTLGRMYFKLPGMFGGDNNKSEALLREAVAKSVERNSLNSQYLAETLVANNKKDEARKVLDDVLQYESNPAAYNDKRVPEFKIEIVEIKKLRDELGN